MAIEAPGDVVALKRIGRIVSKTLQQMRDAAEPGMTTRELDQIGERCLAEAGARSAPRLAYGFPGSTCISIDAEAAHGIPGDRVIQAGGVLNVDVSAELGGYFADTGGTKVVPHDTPQKTRLCHAAHTALAAAMKEARAGQPIHRIGAAIERTAKAYGFKVIENLGSHGVGRALHEAPEHIAGHHDPSDLRLLREGALACTRSPSTPSGSATERGPLRRSGSRGRGPNRVGLRRSTPEIHSRNADVRGSMLGSCRSRMNQLDPRRTRVLEKSLPQSCRPKRQGAFRLEATRRTTP